MMRRSSRALNAAIPRDVWDPKRHNSKWYDSYAKRIAQRRDWPLKRYSIGIEPERPEDWLEYSKRNLAYAYNGALRACGTFPDMVPLYLEMKEREVQMDVDTMFVMLSRAARFESMSPQHIFMLYDEMVSLGARTDSAVIEVLHTLWGHSLGESPEWREARRLQLVHEYNQLAAQEIEFYAKKETFALMVQQFGRYRHNVEQLNGRMYPEVWGKYIARLQHTNDLWQALSEALWAFVPLKQRREFSNFTLKGLDGFSFPELASALGLSRDETANTERTLFSFDKEINKIFLSAAERVADGVMESNKRERIQLILLNKIFTMSQVHIDVDVSAQLLDIVKYRDIAPLTSRHKKNPNTNGRNGREELKQQDVDAMQLFRVAIRNDARWRAVQPTCDARVIGRYLAARDPWSLTGFSVGQKGFSSFEVGAVKSASEKAEDLAAGSGEAVADAEAPADGLEGAEPAAASPTKEGGEKPATVEEQFASRIVRTNDDVEKRMDDVNKLISSTKVLSPAHIYSKDAADGAFIAPEVYTGKAVFLHRMYSAESSNFGVCQAVFKHMKILKFELDQLCDFDAAKAAGRDEAPIPETQCWVTMLDTFKSMLDYLSAKHRSDTQEGRDEAEALFQEIARFRSEMLLESKTRFGGQFGMVWLEEI